MFEERKSSVIMINKRVLIKNMINIILEVDFSQQLYQSFTSNILSKGLVLYFFFLLPENLNLAIRIVITKL